MASLMQAAQAQRQAGPTFTKPDIASVLAKLSPQIRDVVDRVVAAGMKLMYAPQTKDARMQAVQSQDPVAKKLSENVVGLLLTLDSKTQGGIPLEALFPATIELMVEAANMLQAAGQQVSDQDFKDALLAAHVLISKKLGASNDQIMGAAQQALPGGQDHSIQPPTMPMPPVQPDPNQQQVPQ